MKSNSTGEPLIPVGFKDISLIELLSTDIQFPIRFLLKALASAIIGVETFDYAINFKTIDERAIFVVGIIYVLIIIFTLVILIIRFRRRNAIERNIFDLNTYTNVFPLMFIIYGLANFAIVFLARYAFVRDEYGMSSRYSLQYMFLTIGIVIILFLYIDEVIYNRIYIKKDKKELKLSKSYLKRREKLIAEGKIKEREIKYSAPAIISIIISVACIFTFLLGNITTTTDEIFKADYRKIVYTNLVDVAKNYTKYPDIELENYFEYRRGPEQIKNALETLRRQNLNVFRK